MSVWKRIGIFRSTLRRYDLPQPLKDQRDGGMLYPMTQRLLHCYTARKAVSQCIVISPVSDGRAVGRAVWVCYYNNSKLRQSIMTKIGS